MFINPQLSKQLTDERRRNLIGDDQQQQQQALALPETPAWRSSIL